MRFSRLAALACGVFLFSGIALAQQQDQGKLNITAVDYTKWLWGTQRFDGSLYNFTTVPGEGWGDNGQGTEIELLLSGRPSKWLEVSGRIHSRFSQNEWTNFGGFGGRDPAHEGNPGPCTGGDCGEFDPRSNQYVKLRGLTVRATPGMKYLDSVTIGASDWGMFDPFTIGKIRYIDRDNGAGLLFQGAIGKLSYDAARISLPRLWAGPNYSTGDYPVQDAAYGFQFKYSISPMVDFVLGNERVRDVEVAAGELNVDDGRDVVNRFRNDVYSLRAGIHPSAKYDIRLAAYRSSSDSNPALTPANFFGLSGFSPVPAGKHQDESYKANLDITDPFGVGLSFNVEYFNIGAGYVSMMAARRESDVLLTEGHDSTWAFPGPNNAAFGVFEGNPTKIGYGGWQGNAQQVATINVDNEFSDFDEPMAESVIGWKGLTVVPVWNRGGLDLAGELTFIDYNTNWQAFGDPSQPVTSTVWPVTELDTGVGHNFRTAYAPFQDKETKIGLVRGKYTLGVGKGIDLFGKLKFIDETDKRLNDARYLPYQAGDCPGGGVECAGNKNFYFGSNTTADIYGNPPIITVNGVTGYKWKPFNSISDDDRDLNYKMLQIGAGYQFTDLLYSSLSLEHYDVDLKDGNTAFQAYQLHEMASGQHDKNNVILLARYTLGGAEFGFNYEYSFGTFDPDFGGGFVPQVATEDIAAKHFVKVGSLGFEGRFGGWNSLEKRDFEQQRIKAFMKVRF